MLDALELALRSQQLPIRNREIQIDSDIRQIRLTRLGNDTPVTLRSNEITIGADNRNGDINYYSGTGYQTLIWSNPVPGRYTLTEQFGPTDRILIDSDVRLELADLPPTISADQTLGLSASISKNGELVDAEDRTYFVAFGSNTDPVRARGERLTMQIDSPATGRSILTIQSFDGSYERQVQRAFEVLRARPAMEIVSESTQGVGQISSTIVPPQADSTATMGDVNRLLPETINQQLPEEMRDWPLWQLMRVR